jgi:hypothetical protein
MLRKRPCRICHRWFQPDPRVGDRQRVCSSAGCQVARRQKTQASWRERNPDYFGARRLKERAANAAPPPALPPEPLRVPPPLNRLPWDVAQDEFGHQGADFLGLFGRVLLGAVQDQRRAQGSRCASRVIVSAASRRRVGGHGKARFREEHPAGDRGFERHVSGVDADRSANRVAEQFRRDRIAKSPPEGQKESRRQAGGRGSCGAARGISFTEGNAAQQAGHTSATRGRSPDGRPVRRRCGA